MFDFLNILPQQPNNVNTKAAMGNSSPSIGSAASKEFTGFRADGQGVAAEPRRTATTSPALIHVPAYYDDFKKHKNLALAATGDDVPELLSASSAGDNNSNNDTAAMKQMKKERADKIARKLLSEISLSYFA
eukprot:Nk52_evm1s1265 gene=Nk52_evmTU1s1265